APKEKPKKEKGAKKEEAKKAECKKEEGKKEAGGKKDVGAYTCRCLLLYSSRRFPLANSQSALLPFPSLAFVLCAFSVSLCSVPLRPLPFPSPPLPCAEPSYLPFLSLLAFYTSPFVLPFSSPSLSFLSLSL